MSALEAVSRFAFLLPGWERSRFLVRGTDLHFEWTLPQSDGTEAEITLSTQAPLRIDMTEAEVERAAWFCVRMAVLHEAGEHFAAGEERPWHPHHWKWWEWEYKKGPGVLEKGS